MSQMHAADFLNSSYVLSRDIPCSLCKTKFISMYNQGSPFVTIAK